MGKNKTSKSEVAAIRFTLENLEFLNQFAIDHFQDNRSKAVNYIVTKYQLGKAMANQQAAEKQAKIEAQKRELSKFKPLSSF